jgi:hypothetical protein
MPELVTVPVSFVEILIDFERPDVRIWLDRATIVQDVFDALLPWNAEVDDIEAVTTGKTSEQGVTFKIPLKRISFFVGSAYCRFTRDALDWRLAAETLVILNALLGVLLKSTRLVLAARKTRIALHIQPRTGSFMKILSPFIPPQLGMLEDVPAATMAAVVTWPKRKVTLDASTTVGNALLLQFEREFDGATDFVEILRYLSLDEEELFRILDIEVGRA